MRLAISLSYPATSSRIPKIVTRRGAGSSSGWVGTPASGRRAAVALGAALAVALVVGGGTVGEASAALLAAGDGTGNTTSPATDFGFHHVGVLNGLSGVYVRSGWVLTANHVGEGTIVLDGVAYPAIVGSTVRLTNPDASVADLILFKLARRPPLPDLAITDAPPTAQTDVYVAGHGADRGATVSWMGIDGWQWTGAHTLRWGTNRISVVGDYTFDTHAFRITFDDPANAGTQSEADIVVGDSGGGAFTGTGASAKLVGILFARAAYAGQPAETSLYGNIGLIADLYAYRDLILSITDQPECSDGLDDDGNGLIDFPADPGCLAPTDAIEAPEPDGMPAFAAGVFTLLALSSRRSLRAQTSSTRSTR